MSLSQSEPFEPSALLSVNKKYLDVHIILYHLLKFYFLLSISTKYSLSSYSFSVTLSFFVLCCSFVMLSFFLSLLFSLPRSCWAWPQMPARSGRRRGGSEERRGRRPYPSPSRAERNERQTVRFLVFSSICLYFS